MDSEINVYEIAGQEPIGFTLLYHGPIVEVFQKKRYGVHCIETENEFFKVSRDGNIIVPVLRPSIGKIVLSYDSSFYNGDITYDNYIELTQEYNLNIQDIYNESENILSLD